MGESSRRLLLLFKVGLSLIEWERERLRVGAWAEGGGSRPVNTSGLDYRGLGLKDKLPAMSEAEAIALLAGNGNLVKRPFVLGPKVGLVGFDETVWAAALG